MDFGTSEAAGRSLGPGHDAAASETPQQGTSLFIVGVGASAGGLEALERFFRAVPPDSGMAFVVIQHLSPDFKSVMDELLARHTRMPIHRVEDGMSVEANHVYLIPPKKEMIISGGRLLLTDKEPGQELSLPIDHFFRSLASDAGRCAIAVVLSGTGSDGSRGIRDVHEAGGVVLVQSEETARFDGMPKSARDTGIVDCILSPDDMPKALIEYIRRLPADGPCGDEEEEPENLSGVQAIFKLLRDEYGIDFSHYKPNTVTRRIERRLSLNQSLDLEDYVQRLRTDATELNSLYRDLLIGVTRFFRDRDAFERIERDVLPDLLLHKRPEEEVRVWVAGCATGEEAYSLAILIHERLQILGRQVNVKIFAGDVHKASLDVASAGVYPEEALSEVKSDRLSRYFQKKGDGFHVATEIRQMIVFARHNIIKDAPFTKLDMISCRNLLIYFQPAAQKKALSLFHFGLKTGGVLFLGPSETPGELAPEFEGIDDHWKIYRKRRDLRLPPDMRLPLSIAPAQVRFAGTSPSGTGADGSVMLAYDRLLDEYMPPGLLVTERRQLVHAFGNAGRFLKHPDGRPSSDVLDLLDNDLKLALAGAIQRAAKDQKPVAYTGVRVKGPNGEEQLKLAVKPILNRQANLTHLFISLETVDQPKSSPTDATRLDVNEASREHVHTLESELRYTRENLQATIEELETSNEELQAANEELVASNEELQSTNEELHSVNEELYTVNAEYQKKITELTELTDDMDNLLRSTDVGTIFLDKGLCIRKFTPQIGRAFDLLPQDVGRRIDSFSHNITHPELLRDVQSVLQSGEPIEKEVQDRAGNWLFLRILPYRSHSRLDGVVLTLIDISRIKEAHRDIAQRASLSALRADIAMSLARDIDLPEMLQTCAQGFIDHLGVSLARIWILGDDEHQLELAASAGLTNRIDGPQSRVPVGTLRIGRVAQQRVPLVANDIRYDPQIDDPEVEATESVVAFAGYPLLVGDRLAGVLAIFLKRELPRSTQDEISSVAFEIAQTIERKRGADELRRKALELEAANRELETRVASELQAQHEAREGVRLRDQFLAVLSHELRNPLAAIVNAAAILQCDGVDAELIDEASGSIGRQSRQMARLLDDLLDVSRITRDKIEIRPVPVDMRESTNEALDAVKSTVTARDLKLYVQLPDKPVCVEGDLARLQQIQLNLLTNAIRYTAPGGEIRLSLEQNDGEAVLRVRDSGIGIAPSMRDRIFDLFVQVDETAGKTDGGMGVGLTLVRSLVELHRGTVTVQSDGLGHGSEFIVRLPIHKDGLPRYLPAVVPSVDGCKVLVIEDNNDIRRMTERLLKLIGCHVVSAADGASGLRELERSAFDVALIDIGLPEIDGYEVARRIRCMEGRNNIRLIAATGFGQSADLEKSRHAGFDLHLVKPLGLGDLRNAVLRPNVLQTGDLSAV